MSLAHSSLRKFAYNERKTKEDYKEHYGNLELSCDVEDFGSPKELPVPQHYENGNL